MLALWGLTISVMSTLSAAHDRPYQAQTHDAKSAYIRSENTYHIPDVMLLDQDGKHVSLRALLNADKPTLMQFVFTTCTTICPVLGATFAVVREDLDPIGRAYRMVSISIDPEPYCGGKRLDRPLT